MTSTEELLSSQSAGVLHFGRARMALLDIEAGFWGLRRQLEALVGDRLADFVLQQAGTNGGASFAGAFIADAEIETAVALRECVAAYQAAGFGRLRVEEMDWPLGRVCIRAEETVESWMAAQHNQRPERPVCAYSAGVLVGFINVLTGRRDIVCVEHTCQACGDPACTFELLPADEAGTTAVVGFDPDPFLSRQLNLLDILFDRMPMGIAIFDRDLRICRFNPTWADFIDRYTQAGAEEIAPGVPLFDLLPDLEESFRPLFQRVLAGETIKEEALPSTSGGVTSYWDAVFTPLHDGDRIIGVLDVVIDATERQRMVADLRESEAHLISMLDSAQGYAIYRLAVDYEASYLGRVVMVSPSIREVVGIENPYDFSAWFESIHPDDAERVTAANRRAMEEGVTFDETMRFFHFQKEEWRWIHTVSNPVFDQGGQLTHFNGIIIDVTDQKQAEAMLAQHTAVLEKRVTERTQELSTLLEVSQNVASTLELEPLLGVVLDQLRAVVGYDGASILELADETLHLLAYRGPIPANDARRLRFSLAEAGANRAVIEKREPIIIPDVRANTPLAAAFRETAGEGLETTFGYVRSWMGAPLIARGQVLGMISLDHGRPDFYTPERARLAQAFAGQVAVFIENGRLYTETRQRADEARAAYNVQQAITRRLDPDAVLQMIADEARRLTDTQMSAVYLLDEDQLQITVVSGDVATEMVGYRLPVEKSIAGLVVQNRRPFLVPDAAVEERVHRELVEQVGANSFVIVPLMSEEEPIGTITVANKQGRPLGPDDERVLTLMASGAVIALENARLYESEHERREESERRRRVAEELRSIVQMLNSGRPLDEVLDYIVGQAVELMGGETAVAIYRIDAEAGRSILEAERGLPPSVSACRELPVTLVGKELLQRPEPLVVPDVLQWLPPPAGTDPPQIQELMRTTRETYRSYLTVPLLIRGEVYGGMAFHYEQPRQFPAESINLALTLGDQAALAIENARLYESEQERRQVAEGLRDILARLNSERSLPELLDAIVAQAESLLGSDVVALYLLEDNGEELKIQASRGELGPMMREMVLPLGVGTVGRVAAERRPLIVPDVARLPIHEKEERAYEKETAVFVDDPWQETLQEAMRRFRAVLAVPLVTQGAVYGGLAFYHHQPHAFSEEAVDLAMTFADQAALAIQNARLRGRAEQAAVAQERNRLARELHDAVTQTLFSASLIADVLPRIWEKDPAQGRARLDELRELTRGALAEMRTLLLELRPATLTESSLVELLQQLRAAVVGRSRLPVALRVEGERPLSPDIQVALYRIAQEALNNVVKHAGADQVIITLRFGEDEVELTVRDNGRGFDPADVAAQSLGVGIMQERAEKIGAALTIDSQIGRGTTIKVTSPIVA